MYVYEKLWQVIVTYRYAYILNQYYYADHLPELKIILYKTIHLVIDVYN